MKKRIWLFLLIFFPCSVFAKSEFSIKCDKNDKININEQVVCRVSVDSDFLFDNIKYEVDDSENFEIIDIRSNYEKKWEVTNDANIVNAKTTDLENGLQEFGIILIKAIKSGENELKLSNIELINSNSKETKKVDDASVKIKVISTDNLLTNILINDKELQNFDAENNSYTIIINDEKSIKIDAISSNEFAKISGDGEFKLSENINIFYFPVTVISEDNVSKIYSLKIVREHFNDNDIDKKLEKISVKDDKGNDIIFGFKPDNYEYTIEVGMDTKYLDIKPSLSNKNVSFVKNYGNQKINLLSGNNIALIKVEDKEGQVINYVLNIIKPIANKSSNNYIKELIIDGYDLKFNKRIKNYTLYIKAKDSKLNIKPLLENDNAKYDIIGNKNLKSGSVIKIIVTAENEEKTVYNINIKAKENHTLLIISLVFSGCLLILLAYKLRYKILKTIKKVFKIFKKIKISKINIKRFKLLKLPRVNKNIIKKIKISKINISFFKKIKFPKINIRKVKLFIANIKNKITKLIIKYVRTPKSIKKNNSNNKKSQTKPSKETKPKTETNNNHKKLNNKKKSPSKKKVKNKKKGKTNYKKKK